MLAQISVSTTLPSAGKPEHLYTMVNGNSVYANGKTGTTKTEANYGQFAFYASDTDGQYYIYSYTAGKWLSYTVASSYSNQTNFVSLVDDKSNGQAFIVNNYSGSLYQLQPITSSATGDKYLNWYEGLGSNKLDTDGVTLGLWKDGGSADAGSRWTFSEVLEPADGATPALPSNLSEVHAKYTKGNAYSVAVVYPEQQTAVGEASLATDDGIYTLYNNVLAASFVKERDYLWFGGSSAMNLEAGTEPFSISFGTGYTVPASAMTLKSVETENLTADASAVGGAEHYAGKALVAKYEYTYSGKTLNVTWRAVLRDGSHYLRTEMELTGNDVDMYNVIPMIYNVNAKEAGSTPAVVGNTRGAVLMSDKLFAGLEHPTAYNTVGDTTGDEDKYELTTTYDDVTLASTDWTDMEDDLVPDRIVETTGKTKADIYEYTKGDYSLTEGQKVQVTLAYTSGNHKLYIGGVDMYSTSASSIDANDYHMGYTGSANDKNVYTFIAPHTGTYTIRLMLDAVSESIDATSKLTVKVYTLKEGETVNTDIVPIQGRWSRNTTLESGETWKISAVVGLVAPKQARRSILAYSERERAVPWRPNPAYISWYELNINRNNAAPGSETSNMVADQVLAVERQWKTNMYDRFGMGPNSFVIDDGWDTYGEWQFHSGFPNEMRDISALADSMGAGVGAWLGPVGGYGASGNYRRAYWNENNRGGMVLSNPAYYTVFKKAASNLVNNQGTKSDGSKSFQFFKFDGISAQFSATGPDDGDTGNENAEGIIRLERYVREELKRDIFFNTTVGTWASPFWFHYTDAVWRQENDYGTIGNNTIDRENWITYRDRLVYQNFVKNSPVCPINTLMTHGFILSSYGSVSKNMTYEAVRRELRCAFACGSGMVELYNDYALMNSIQNGQLWADLAECIKWQKANADVLPDAHWVGGNPWDGSKANIYGWAAWNGKKATFTLRNGSNDEQSITLTLRDALDIPASVTGSVILKKSFLDQAALSGLTEGEAINIDTQLTLTLPASSVYMFDGRNSTEAEVKVSAITTNAESYEVTEGKTCGIRAAANADATYSQLSWTSSDTSIATVYNGLVRALAAGECTITIAAADGSGVTKTVKVVVNAKPFEPYATNFDKTASAVGNDRKIQTITFQAGSGDTQTITVNHTTPYLDMTSTKLTCKAGATVNSTMKFNGSWMNGYVYIDANNDAVFSYNAGSTDQSNTELYSFSYYNGVNSLGTSLSSGNHGGTITLPAFTAPTTPGTYRIRFKLDWSDVDPGGRIAADGTCTGSNGILANRGGIIDMTLKVYSFTHTLSNGALTVTDGTVDDDALTELKEMAEDNTITSYNLKAADLTATKLADFADAFHNVTIYVADGCTAEGADKVVKGSSALTYALTDSYYDSESQTTLYPALSIPADFTANKVTYNREFTTTDGYVSTFILPFGFAVPEGVTVGKLSRVEDNTLVYSVVTTTEANTPYVVVTNQSNFVNNLSNVEVKATTSADLTVEADGVKHIGAYDTKTVTGAYGYIQGKFVQATNGTVKPFRTYIEVTSSSSAAPKSFNVAIEDPLSGISQVVGALDAEANVPVYNLQGVRQNGKLAKGVYIVNGKKLIK